MIRIELTEGHALVDPVFPGLAQEMSHAFCMLNRDEQEELRRVCGKLGKAADEVQTIARAAKKEFSESAIGAPPNENKNEHTKKESNNGIS